LQRFIFNRGNIEYLFGVGAIYVEVLYDIKAIYGKGRLLVHATFDDEPCDGQGVKMGTPCYVVG